MVQNRALDPDTLSTSYGAKLPDRSRRTAPSPLSAAKHRARLRETSRGCVGCQLPCPAKKRPVEASVYYVEDGNVLQANGQNHDWEDELR